jgi:hypothetical protein
MKGATEFQISSAPELATFSEEIARAAVGPSAPNQARRLERFGDQSFFGVGVSSVTARHTFARNVVDEYNGATLGWWNHTEQDTMERVDLRTLALDARYWLDFIRALATVPVLPHRFGPRLANLRKQAEKMLSGCRDPADLTRIVPLVEALHARVRRFDEYLDKLSASANPEERALERANRTTLRLGRCLTFISTTATGKYGQDSYGISTLAQPIPMLATLLEYNRVDPTELQAKLLASKLIRQRQQITDALYHASLALEDFG